jgi:hypothetical protein
MLPSLGRLAEVMSTPGLSEIRPPGTNWSGLSHRLPYGTRSGHQSLGLSGFTENAESRRKLWGR